MLKSFWLFVKSNLLVILTVILAVALFIPMIIGLFLPQKTANKIVGGLDGAIDKLNLKKVEIASEKKQIDLEKEIKLQNLDEKKQELTKRIEVVQKIPDLKTRLQAQIDLHKQIKAERGIK